VVDSDDIAGRVSVVDLEIRLEESKLFNRPNLGSGCLSGRTLVALRAAKPLRKLWAVEHAVGQCIEEGVDIGLREVASHWRSDDGWCSRPLVTL
jgi:hypothetical protein